MSEKVKEIIGEELYQQVVDKLGDKKIDLLDGYIPRTRLNEVTEKLKIYEGKITSYEDQIKDTSKLLKDNEELKNSFESLQNKYKQDLTTKDIEISNITKRSILKSKLNENGAKYSDLLLKEVDISNLSIENDNIKDVDNIINTLKTNYSDMFVVKETKGNDITNKSKGQSKDKNNTNWEDVINKFI